MQVSEAISGVIQRFKDGNLPEAIAHVVHPRYEMPMTKWSFCNQMIAFLSGTSDGRGFNQWKEVNRYVKKGAKAFHILAPRMSKTGSKDDEGNEIFSLKGFVCVPIFRVEETEGEDLIYETIDLPPLPLLDVAEKLGVTVKTVSGNDSYLGYYSDSSKTIGLASPDEAVFFHELVHAAHSTIEKRKLGKGQQPDREIIAELGAASLGYLVGRAIPGSIGNHFRYIEQYAEKEGMNVLGACMAHFAMVQQVLQLIINNSTTELI